ncbi:MAG: LytR C-terminal domain-containing protein [Candidatus Levyibacteriota bacterium]
MEETNFTAPQEIKKSKKSPKRFLFLLLFLIILVGAGFGVKNFLGSQSNQAQEIETTPTPTEYQFPTDTPVPLESPTPESLTPSPKPTLDPLDKATGLDRSDLTVEIQNGSGEKLVASKASDVLKILGYHVISIGNADNFDYEGTTIQVKESVSEYLSLLKKDLSIDYSVTSSSAELSASSSADALVIIGK